MDGKSLDINASQFDKLKQLFPEAITEGKVDWEKLKLSLGDDLTISNERYVLNWAGKSDAFRAIQTPTTATLKPQKDQSIDFDTTENIFIEGENLEVLKVLQKSYYGKIKMIYIDPPYNTGNDSFIYPDKFSESKDEYLKRIGDKDEAGYLTKEGFFRKNSKENGQYHSNWLSMMYPRLFLARNLLRDDGVIFVSIDDNEVHNLRLLMNEIFGEENFIASIIWQHSVQPKGYLEKFSVHHNYTLCYQKTNEFDLNALERTEEHNKHYSNPDNDPKGKWRSGDVRNALYRPNLIFDIVTPSGNVIKPPKNGWRWSKETIEKKIQTGEIIFNKDKTGIIRKIYLQNVEGRAPETIWFGKDVGTTREAAEELKELFDGSAPFDTPKPGRLVKQMLQLGTESNEGDIVLDFFAGSGTTAHAVLELNKEADGNRKFILAQLPEKTDEESEAYKAGYKTIADICKERIRRVIKKMSEPLMTADKYDKNEEQINMGLSDKSKEKSSALSQASQPSAVGFKVYTLEPSNFKIWRTDVIDSEEDLKRQMNAFVDPARKHSEAEDMAWEIMIKSGEILTTELRLIEMLGVPLFEYAEHDSDKLVVIALENISQKAIDSIIAKKPKKVIALDRFFAGNDQLKTNTALQMKDAGIEFKTI